jgi:hypothetical protein
VLLLLLHWPWLWPWLMLWLWLLLWLWLRLWLLCYVSHSSRFKVYEEISGQVHLKKTIFKSLL